MTSVVALAVTTLLLPAQEASMQLKDADTRIGRVEFENGYTTQESIVRLFDAMAFPTR